MCDKLDKERKRTTVKAIFFFYFKIYVHLIDKVTLPARKRETLQEYTQVSTLSFVFFAF